MTVSSKVKGSMDLHPNLYKHLGLLFRSLNHRLRLQILKFIDKEGEVPVSKIYTALKIEQSVTSQHLAILRKYKLVKTTRDGQFIYYSVNYEQLRAINERSLKFGDIL